MIDTTTESTRRLMLADVLSLLEAADAPDVAEGGIANYRLANLMWSLLTDQASPAQARDALFDRDVERLDGLIFSD